MKDQNKTQKPAMRNVLIILLAFLGLGAIFGGGALVVSPTGELLGMPLSLLEHSPFNDYLIPGIILFSILGIAPCLLILALLKKPVSKFADRFNFFKDMHWAWSYSIYIAFALIIWLQAEMMFIGTVHWIHALYMFLAVVIIFVALLPQLRNLYIK